MGRKMCRFVSLICAVMILCLAGRTNQEVWAMETEATLSEDSNYVVLNVISYDEESNRSLAVVSSTNSANGQITTDGVRLRVKPSTSATVLELMYEGETVWINGNKEAEGGGSWLYIQRIKTGTFGWVAKDYVYVW